ncbi:MAG: beta-ketoacyl-ACP synthase II [Alphaproteobacteria bacterium]
MSRRRVVITGLGVMSSIGQDVSSYWNALCEGKSGIQSIATFDVSAFSTRIASLIPDFDPLKWFDKRLANRTDRYAQFGLAAAIQSVKDSGIDFSKEDPTRCGVVIGTGIGGLCEIETQFTRLIEKGPSRVSPFFVPKIMSNACSGQTSIYYGIRGPNFSAVSACASANHSMGMAFRFVRQGEADVMISGGTEAAVSPLGLAGFCAAGALSKRNDDPQHASRPFDKDRDGFVMGEGAGIVVMEELEHAKTRGARIYAEVLGFGCSSDAYHIVVPDKKGLGPSESMKNCLRDAGASPEDVSYINAHGTSTPLGDTAETKAIKAAFGAYAYKVPVSSTKSMIGHLLGASGGAELVATVLSVANDTIHPTANLDNPDPECDLDYVPNAARTVRVEKAMSNSFGFGGHNGTILVGKAKV